MIVIPAVDLLEGKVVRLLQGDPHRQTIFAQDPVEVARRWHEAGAERLHVVDLDGSLAGRPRNRALVEAIAQGIPIPVQLGGGIRDLETAEAYLEAGVDRIVLGTVAVERPDLLGEACRRWPGRVAAAIDARGGRVTVRGWTQSSGFYAVDLAMRLEQYGAAVLIYTDVERDGTGHGIDLEATCAVARAVRVPVIASGGVASLGDIRALMDVAEAGIQGVIVGRALYTGALDLQAALRLTRGRSDDAGVDE